MTRLERALEVVERIIEWVGIVIMVAMLLISIAEIVARDILNSPIAGSLDLTLLIMIWMVLLVSGIGVWSDLHIRVAFFVDTMNEMAKRVISLIVFVAIFFFGEVATHYRLHSEHIDQAARDRGGSDAQWFAFSTDVLPARRPRADGRDDEPALAVGDRRRDGPLGVRDRPRPRRPERARALL